MNGALEFELVPLKSGTHSLRWIQNREIFHPGMGPMAEANLLHVGQQRFERVLDASIAKFVIWDVGLGAAANAVASIEKLLTLGGEVPVELHSFEKSTGAIEFALTNAEPLGYLLPHRNAVRELLSKGRVKVAPHITWVLHLGDFREALLASNIPAPHSVLFDPYSPKTNSEMWELETFTALRGRLGPPCLVTSYSRSTAVRVTLLLAGFQVGVGVELGQKAETTIASNDLNFLANPLDRRFLERVRMSGSGAPLRNKQPLGSISEQDYEKLCLCSQFTNN